MRKFIITNSSGSKHVVRCNTKWEANKLGKQCETMLGWKVVSIIEEK